MKKENRNWIAWIALGVSGIAIIVSVIAICISCPHIPELGFDYQGVVVGVLSLLVTTLIGWQIYEAVHFKDILKKEVLKASSEIIEANRKTLLISQLNSLYGLHEGAIRNIDINYMLSTLDIMMDIVIDLRDKEKANMILKAISDLHRFTGDIRADNSKKNKYNAIREKIKELASISDTAFDVYKNTAI